MKNKVALSIITLSIIVYGIINMFTLENNIENNPILLQAQSFALMLTFTMMMFIISRYGLLTYLCGYFAVYESVNLILLMLTYPETLNQDIMPAYRIQLFCIILTTIIFYIIKKISVNINKKSLN